MARVRPGGHDPQEDCWSCGIMEKCRIRTQHLQRRHKYASHLSGSVNIHVKQKVAGRPLEILDLLVAMATFAVA